MNTYVLSKRLYELPDAPPLLAANPWPARKVEAPSVMLGHDRKEPAKLVVVKLHSVKLCGNYGSMVYWQEAGE